MADKYFRRTTRTANLSNPSIQKRILGYGRWGKTPWCGKSVHVTFTSRVNSGERMILETLPQEDLKENIGYVCFILPTNSQRRVAPPVSIPHTVFKQCIRPWFLSHLLSFEQPFSFLVYRPRKPLLSMISKIKMSFDDSFLSSFVCLFHLFIIFEYLWNISFYSSWSLNYVISIHKERVFMWKREEGAYARWAIIF